MQPLEKKVLKKIFDFPLLNRGDLVVVAVSGGPDSMALLQVLHAVAGTMELSLVAVYLNHGLRPEEVAREEELVKNRAGLLQIPFQTGAIPVRAFARDRKLSLEHAARLLRYGMLEEIAGRAGAAGIAVAHTADDQAEELLLRLLRGTGRQGLAGMSPVSAARIIRPFLEISKAELLDYLHRNRIPYLLDSSNLSTVHLRNRVRLELLPYLEERYNPNLKETLRQTAEILRDEEEILTGMTRFAYGRSVVEDAGKGGPVRAVGLELGSFALEPKAIQRRILESICWRLESPPSFRIIAGLLELALRDAGGGRMHLAEGLRVSRQARQLVFSYPEGKIARRGGLLQESGFELAIAGPGSYPIPAIGRKVVVSIGDGIPSREAMRAGEAEYLDRSAISFPLALRSPRPGDRFQPLGAPGRKKVKDFLADRKVPAALRWQVPVLVDEYGIAALLGLGIDEARKVTGMTRQTVAFRLEPL